MAILKCPLWVSRERGHKYYLNHVDFSSIGHSTMGQFCFLIMAIFDQFYQHRKELSYSYFKDLFGNGMAWGPKWEHVEVAQNDFGN